MSFKRRRAISMDLGSHLKSLGEREDSKVELERGVGSFLSLPSLYLLVSPFSTLLQRGAV